MWCAESWRGARDVTDLVSAIDFRDGDLAPAGGELAKRIGDPYRRIDDPPSHDPAKQNSAQHPGDRQRQIGSDYAAAMIERGLAKVVAFLGGILHQHLGQLIHGSDRARGGIAQRPDPVQVAGRVGRRQFPPRHIPFGRHAENLADRGASQCGQSTLQRNYVNTSAWFSELNPL